MDNCAVQREIALMRYRADMQLEVAARKAELAEAVSEGKKAQCEEILLDGDGVPVIVTRNLRIDGKPRQLANFTKPEVIKLIKANEVESMYFILTFMLNGKPEYAFISEKRSGQASYLLRKIRSAGAVIKASSAAREKQYVLLLWGYLLKTSSKVKIVPERRGWYKDNDKIFFCKEGECTWEDVIRLAV